MPFVLDHSTQVMTAQIELRPANPSDRRRAYEWCCTSDSAASMFGPPTYPDNPAPTWEEFCRDWEGHFFDGSDPARGQLFVIVADGEDVGMIAQNEIVLVEGERICEIDLWLRSDADTGRGYGSAAVRAMAEHLRRSLSVDIAFLQPSARNPRGIRAYEKAGFTRVDLEPRAAADRYGTEPDYYDSVFLVRDLRR